MTFMKKCPQKLVNNLPDTEVNMDIDMQKNPKEKFRIGNEVKHQLPIAANYYRLLKIKEEQLKRTQSVDIKSKPSCLQDANYFNTSTRKESHMKRSQSVNIRELTTSPQERNDFVASKGKESLMKRTESTDIKKRTSPPKDANCFITSKGKESLMRRTESTDVKKRTSPPKDANYFLTLKSRESHMKRTQSTDIKKQTTALQDAYTFITSKGKESRTQSTGTRKQSFLPQDENYLITSKGKESLIKRSQSADNKRQTTALRDAIYFNALKGNEPQLKSTQPADTKRKKRSVQVSNYYSLLKGKEPQPMRTQSVDTRRQTTPLQAPIYDHPLKVERSQLKRTQSAYMKRQASYLQGWFEKCITNLEPRTGNTCGDFKTITPNVKKPFKSNFPRKTNACNKIRVEASKPSSADDHLVLKNVSLQPSCKADKNLNEGRRKVPDIKPLAKVATLQGRHLEKNLACQHKSHLYVQNSSGKVPDPKRNDKPLVQQNGLHSGNVYKKHFLRSLPENIPHSKFVDKIANKCDNTRKQSFRRCVACDMLPKTRTEETSGNERQLSFILEPRHLNECLVHENENTEFKFVESDTDICDKFTYYGTSHTMTESERVTEWLEGIPSLTHVASSNLQQFYEDRKSKMEKEKRKKANERIEAGKEKYSSGVPFLLRKGHARYEVTDDIKVQKERRYRTRKKDKCRNLW